MKSAAHVVDHREIWQMRPLLLAELLASSLLATALLRAQSASPAAGAAPPPAAARPMNPGTPITYRPNPFPKRARAYYGLFWGIDSLSVKTAESGELVRFSWRVLDPTKAKALNDKSLNPELVDPQAGVKLIVPSMEFVGQMRQSSTPVAGREYWMVFSNPGRHVKSGDRVSVVIGHFHADWLEVE